MKTYLYHSLSLLATTFILAACGTATPTVAPTSASAPAAIATEPPAKAAAPTEAPAPVAAEVGGEGAGGEAPLVPYADAAQGFSIDYPKPWTQDPAVKNGVKFDGDGTMSLAFVKPDAKDALAFATADAQTFAASQPSFKQVGLEASTEVPNAIVLGFETTGTSNVTGKTYAARGDRYYIALKDGRIAVLTVISPVKNYDREGVRDIALTLKVTK
jgi:hypothetical protein